MSYGRQPGVWFPPRSPIVSAPLYPLHLLHFIPAQKSIQFVYILHGCETASFHPLDQVIHSDKVWSLSSSDFPRTTTEQLLPISDYLSYLLDRDTVAEFMSLCTPGISRAIWSPLQKYQRMLKTHRSIWILNSSKLLSGPQKPIQDFGLDGSP